MKKLWITILLAGSSVGVNAESIRFIMEATYPPFESMDENGQLIGFDVDLAKAVCQELKVECQFTVQSFDALIPAVKAKKFDAAISSIDITESRAKQVAFSHSYYDSSAGFIGIKNKSDLAKAQVVGVQNGSTFQQYINQQAKQYTAKSYGALPNSVLDLQNGRIDLIFGDTAVLSEWIKQDSNLTFIGEKITNQQYFGQGFGIAVNKSNTALLQKINQSLSALRENGRYQEIYDKWFSIK
ncbi:transporter substrate-binding domain-containing protein [Rodentibacter caecimuris]|uniref:Arginine ABC transporter substrate-binding protein n=1 Tax=Rodentibacter caecimuris TaxID=1796644 RepID=A0ABX3L157_9PAST|nr:arginine ABC transporter substrate-binding protein [Rodentibacter heylii]